MPLTRPTVRARLTSAVTSPPGKRTYARAWVTVEKGEYVVRPVGGSGSHLIASLAGAQIVLTGYDEWRVALSAAPQVEEERKCGSEAAHDGDALNR